MSGMSKEAVGFNRDWMSVSRLANGVRPLDQTDLQERYDLFIGAVGYEARARSVLEWLQGRYETAVGLVFDHNQVLDFEANLAAFSSANAELPLVTARVAYKTIADRIDALQVGDRPRRIACDVSVLDRTRLASVIMAISDSSTPLDVDFVYSCAEFDREPTAEPPLVIRNPVHERLAGWSADPVAPVALIVGLGLEEEKAVGAVDFLEPALTWAFEPQSSSQEYNDAIATANAALWSIHPPDGRVPYQVLDPFGTFETLEVLLFGLRASFRPVIVPFGPKVFGVCAILAALVHAPDVAVWRLSAGRLHEPRNCFSDGTFTGLRMSVRRDSGR